MSSHPLPENLRIDPPASCQKIAVYYPDGTWQTTTITDQGDLPRVQKSGTIAAGWLPLREALDVAATRRAAYEAEKQAA